MKAPIIILVVFNIILIGLATYYFYGRKERNLKLNVEKSKEIKRLKEQMRLMEANYKQILTSREENEGKQCPPCIYINTSPKKLTKDEIPWLIIGIPTTPRSNANYLTDALSALNQVLPIDQFDPFYKKVKIMVMTHSQEDKQFETLKNIYKNNPHFEFVYKPQIKPKNPSAKKYQQQSLDVADLLVYAGNKSQYYLFMEDDFKICPNGLKSLYHLISKSNYYHDNWIAIRCSFGLNGIIYHNNQDILRFAKYLQNHHERRPPDHLLTEFSASETKESMEYVNKRIIVGYRYNLFEHIGKVSSIGNKDWGFPGCYHELLYPTTFEVEAFNKNQCSNDDIWPCKVTPEKKDLLPWIDWNKK